MNNNRIKLVQHLLEVTKDKPIERQLREQWLAELAQYKLSKREQQDVVQPAKRHEPLS